MSFLRPKLVNRSRPGPAICAALFTFHLSADQHTPKLFLWLHHKASVSWCVGTRRSQADSSICNWLSDKSPRYRRACIIWGYRCDAAAQISCTQSHGLRSSRPGSKTSSLYRTWSRLIRSIVGLKWRQRLQRANHRSYEAKNSCRAPLDKRPNHEDCYHFRAKHYLWVISLRASVPWPFQAR